MNKGNKNSINCIRKHIVVIGGGFAGLNFIKKINLDYYDVTVVDKNNYHSFPPLFYQVASAGLDPASICFPLRRELRKRRRPNLRFCMGDVRQIDVEKKYIVTRDQHIDYDILIIAAGTINNFFNMPELEKEVYTIKSTPEAVRCRNDILDRLEKAAIIKDPEEQKKLLNFVVIGGGPTGVEIAGSIGEMKRYVIPREYPTIPQENVTITLVEGTDKLLGVMSEASSKQAKIDLEKLMVNVRTKTMMKEYADGKVTFTDGESIPASMVIWTAGVTSQHFHVTGTNLDYLGPGKRFMVDHYCRVMGMKDVYAIGDIAYMTADTTYPKGHPQLAQPAIQQGALVAENLNRRAVGMTKGISDPTLIPFTYNDKGSMATIGRNKAVVDMKHMHMNGFVAWLAWMFVHLISILGMRNKITVLINWIWAYFNYSTSLRLLIHPARYPERKRWLD